MHWSVGLRGVRAQPRQAGLRTFHSDHGIATEAWSWSGEAGRLLDEDRSLRPLSVLLLLRFPDGGRGTRPRPEPRPNGPGGCRRTGEAWNGVRAADRSQRRRRLSVAVDPDRIYQYCGAPL